LEEKQVSLGKSIKDRPLGEGKRIRRQKALAFCEREVLGKREQNGGSTGPTKTHYTKRRHKVESREGSISRGKKIHWRGHNEGVGAS